MAEREAHGSPGYFPGESDAAWSRQWAVKNVGGALMIAAAVLVTGVTVLTDLRHDPFPAFTRTANYSLSGFIALSGLLLLCMRTSPRRVPDWVANSIPSAAAIVVSVPTAADEPPAELGPLLLTWPVTFSAAVLSARAAWSTVCTAGVVFAVLVGFSRGVDGVTVWLEVVASLVVICWMVVRIQSQSSKLRGMLSDLARTDALTGLLNRRGFDEALGREYERVRRGGPPMGVLLVDIDHFKRVNDTWGHQAGDTTLRRLGELLAELFRATDVVGRIGGEEFAVLIPDCGPELAVRRAHEMCDSVRTVTRGWEHSITVSVGVATRPEAASAPAEVLAAADAALYEAKAAGRDRVRHDGMLPKW